MNYSTDAGLQDLPQTPLHQAPGKTDSRLQELQVSRADHCRDRAVNWPPFRLDTRA